MFVVAGRYKNNINNINNNNSLPIILRLLYSTPTFFFEIVFEYFEHLFFPNIIFLLTSVPLDILNPLIFSTGSHIE